MKKVFILRTDDDRARFVRWVNKFALTKPVQFTIELYRKRRSVSQNALMWIWLHEIATETGNDADDLHDLFKRKYLLPDEKEILGEVHQVYTTRTLSTVEFTEYLTRIEAFMATGYGITLTQPEASGWR